MIKLNGCVKLVENTRCRGAALTNGTYEANCKSQEYQMVKTQPLQHSSIHLRRLRIPCQKQHALRCMPNNKRALMRLILTLMLVIQATGCIVGPDFTHPPEPILQPDYVAKQQIATADQIDVTQWWHSFGDPKLNEILTRAQSQNLPLREAYERIVEARAALGLQGAQLRPNGDLVAEYEYEKNAPNSQPFVGSTGGDPFDLFTLGFDTSWEIDLFGRLQRGIEAAGADLQFQTNDYEFIRRTLLADIVDSYLRIRLLQSQSQLISESLTIQSETAVLVQERLAAGVSTELDQTQTESFRFRTEALLASVRQQIDIEFNQLSLLLGQSPNFALREYVGVMPVPAIPPVPAVGFPANLLRRRPDISREEAAVKAASARIGVAVADLYPQLTLLGEVNVSAQTVSSLFETNGLEFNVGPSFRWNILHFGRITNNIEIQESQLRQAIARYQETALQAVREVENAMVNHRGFLEQWAALNQAMEADQKSVDLSLQRYRAGKANFQRVLDSQQQLLDDRRQSLDAQTQAIIQLVRLYKASGGGWENLNQQTTVCQPAVCQPIVHQPVVLHTPVYQPVVHQLVVEPQRYPLQEQNGSFEQIPLQPQEGSLQQSPFEQSSFGAEVVPKQISNLPEFQTVLEAQTTQAQDTSPPSDPGFIYIESPWDNSAPDETSPNEIDSNSFPLLPELEDLN